MKKSLLILALALAATLPLHADIFVATTTNNQLVTFDSSAPATFLTSVAITGLVGTDGVTADPGATLVNLALNSSSNLYYGLDTNANFYRVDLGGAATLINNTFSPSGFAAGFAYDPFTDKFVFASDNAESVFIDINGNRTVNANLVYAEDDVNEASTPIIFCLGIDPVTGEAYFADAVLGVLGQAVDPLLREIFTVGSLGTSITSFGGLTVNQDGLVFGALSTDGLTSSLYSIDTATGTTTSIGSFGSGVGIHSIAITAVPEPSTVFAALGLGALLVWRIARRRSLASHQITKA